MIHRDIDSLNVKFQPVVRMFLTLLDKKGIKYSVIETFREQAVQDAYYLMGRASLAEVNDARKKAGIFPISEKENKIITQVRHSKHTEGLAIDIAPFDGKSILWNDLEKFKLIGACGKACGMIWGGDWTEFKDYPHFQMV